MATVVVITAPLVLLACAAIFQSLNDIVEEVPNDRITSNPSADAAGFPDYTITQQSSSNLTTSPQRRLPLPHVDAESVLTEVLRRCDVDHAAFLRHRALVEDFISEATRHLTKLSPLLTSVTAHHDGSAFEGTRTMNSADFDTYALISSDAVLRHFELLRGAKGRISARLRLGVNRHALAVDLAQAVTKDGYLDARRFKKWSFRCLEAALRRTAENHPLLRPVVFSTHGAVGANLTAPDGVLLQVDFTAQLGPSPAEGEIREQALTPCGLRLVPPGRPAPWSVYSSVDLTVPAPSSSSPIAALSTASGSGSAVIANNTIDASEADEEGDYSDDRWFVIDTMELEHSLLTVQPALRSIVRLLKSLSTARRWGQRFHVASFIFKHTVFWTFAEDCGGEVWRSRAGLLSPTVASLRTLERALRRGGMDRFFVGPPVNNALGSIAGGRAAMLRLAEEIHQIIGVLIRGDHKAIADLYGI